MLINRVEYIASPTHAYFYLWITVDGQVQILRVFHRNSIT